jgi:hypothetical protein
MLLPAIQYGDWPIVKGRMRKVVTQLKRGAGLIELMTKDGMLDTADNAGLIVMVRSSLGPVSNFHCFAPWRLAWEAASLAESTAEAMFAASLEVPWGILGLMSSDNGPWVWPEHRHRPFLEAALWFWEELDAVGARYYVVGKGERLWGTARNLKYVLANMGVPNDVLSSPLPPEGPRALLRYARPAAQA